MSLHSFKRLVVLALVALAPALSLAGCNTIGGAGRDVSSVGRHVANGADGAR